MGLKRRSKKPKEDPEESGQNGTGIVLVKDGVQREVSVAELALSNTLSLEALVRVLSRSEAIDPDELLEEMEKVKTERFRTGLPAGDDGTAH